VYPERTSVRKGTALRVHASRKKLDTPTVSAMRQSSPGRKDDRTVGPLSSDKKSFFLVGSVEKRALRILQISFAWIDHSTLKDYETIYIGRGHPQTNALFQESVLFSREEPPWAFPKPRGKPRSFASEKKRRVLARKRAAQRPPFRKWYN